jgi:hypothetical protein
MCIYNLLTLITICITICIITIYYSVCSNLQTVLFYSLYHSAVSEKYEVKWSALRRSRSQNGGHNRLLRIMKDTVCIRIQTVRRGSLILSIITLCILMQSVQLFRLYSD